MKIIAQLHSICFPGWSGIFGLYSGLDYQQGNGVAITLSPYTDCNNGVKGALIPSTPTHTVLPLGLGVLQSLHSCTWVFVNLNFKLSPFKWIYTISRKFSTMLQSVSEWLWMQSGKLSTDSPLTTVSPTLGRVCYDLVLASLTWLWAILEAILFTCFIYYVAFITFRYHALHLSWKILQCLPWWTSQVTINI